MTDALCEAGFPRGAQRSTNLLDCTCPRESDHSKAACIAIRQETSEGDSKTYAARLQEAVERILGSNYQTTAFKLGLVHIDELVLVEAAVDYKVEEGDGSHEGLYQAED